MSGKTKEVDTRKMSDTKKVKSIDYRDVPNDVILYITRSFYLFEVEFMEAQKPNLSKTYFGKLSSYSYVEKLSKTRHIFQIFGSFRVFQPEQFSLLPVNTRGVEFCRNNIQIPRNLMRNTFSKLEYLGKFSIVDEGEEVLLKEVPVDRFSQLDVRILSFDDDLLNSFNSLRSLRILDLEVKSAPLRDPTVDLTLANLRRLSVTKVSMYKKNFRILSNSISFSKTPQLRHLHIRCSQIDDKQIQNICHLRTIVDIRLIGCELGETYFKLFENPIVRKIHLEECKFTIDHLSRVQIKGKGGNSLNQVSFNRIQDIQPNAFPTQFLGELLKKGDEINMLEFQHLRLGNEFLEYFLENFRYEIYKNGRKMTMKVNGNPDIGIDICRLVEKKTAESLILEHS